jgi:hypothetical protein
MSPKRSTTLNDVIATARAQDRIFDRGMALLENGNRSLAEEVTLREWRDHVEGKLKQCVETWVHKRAQWDKGGQG